MRWQGGKGSGRETNRRTVREVKGPRETKTGI